MPPQHGLKVGFRFDAMTRAVLRRGARATRPALFVFARSVARGMVTPPMKARGVISELFIQDMEMIRRQGTGQTQWKHGHNGHINNMP